jgi:hypothetical protein
VAKRILSFEANPLITSDFAEGKGSRGEANRVEGTAKEESGEKGGEESGERGGEENGEKEGEGR